MAIHIAPRGTISSSTAARANGSCWPIGMTAAAILNSMRRAPARGISAHPTVSTGLQLHPHATTTVGVQVSTSVATVLFTDIEGSTRLWEEQREMMSAALARHDAMSRAAVERNRGVVVKMTGDGMCAAFDDPVDALQATVTLLKSLHDASATSGLRLRVRVGLHAGMIERRDDDVFGTPVNRAARIMKAAHGDQRSEEHTSHIHAHLT